MKKTLLFVSLFGSFVLQAQDTEKLQPCMEIKKACEGAGFKSGLQRAKTKDTKGSVKDCMSKLTNGESVSGVNVSADVISGCKEKHEK
jgi:hypothetical protein